MLNDKESNEVHKLDDVDGRLYRRDLAGRKERTSDFLRARRTSVDRDWGALPVDRERIKKMAKHPTFFKKFFFGSITFAAAALVLAVIIFFTGGNTVSNNNIDIRVLGNSFAAGGEELPLQVQVINHNTSDLELADLFVEYEKGGDTTGGAAHVRDLDSLGTVNAGKTTTKSLFVTLFGEEGTSKTIDFTLQYRLHGSNAIFIKKSSFAVTLSSAPVALTIDAPKNVTPNQDVSLTVTTKSNSKNTLNAMLLRVDYPTGFKFKKAVPDASSFNNVWNLGDLAPGASRSIVITGTIYGQDGEDRAFHAYTGAANASDSTQIGITYNSLLQVVALVKPFLAAHIIINGSDAAQVPVASSGTVHVSVPYENNLPTSITDAEVTLQFSGNSFDPSTVQPTNGFYDSSRKAVVWNATTGANLSQLQPGDNGTLDVSFTVRPSSSSAGTAAQSSVGLAVSISGKQPDQGGLVSNIVNSEQKLAVVSSDLGFSSNAFYNSGPFSNTGPLPPKVGSATTYTITWAVTNSANALADGLATAILPTYVDWMGVVSPSNEPIEYDTTTHTIRWKIGAIPANTGLGAASKTVSFQIRFNPSDSQVGTIPKLVMDVAVSARDTFTSELIKTTRPGTTTILSNDEGWSNDGKEIVTN